MEQRTTTCDKIACVLLKCEDINILTFSTRKVTSIRCGLCKVCAIFYKRVISKESKISVGYLVYFFFKYELCNRTIAKTREFFRETEVLVH